MRQEATAIAIDHHQITTERALLGEGEGGLFLVVAADTSEPVASHRATFSPFPMFRYPLAEKTKYTAKSRAIYGDLVEIPIATQRAFASIQIQKAVCLRSSMGLATR